MTEPSVVCVCLYADRPQFIARMLTSFRAQTYPNKRLLIYDSGEDPFGPTCVPGEWTIREVSAHARSIGVLRNEANSIAAYKADIIAHWDVDDWSHPNRLAEQVALLHDSNPRDGRLDAVGYREMLFWDSRGAGETWLYGNRLPSYCLCTSLMYWRRTWERKPFPDLNVGEGTEWQKGLRTLGDGGVGTTPRMIAEIHGQNTSPAYDTALMAATAKQGKEWTRAPQWDSVCREVMK